MFVNHGTLPSVVASMSDREIALCWAMAMKEMNKRKEG